MSLSECTNQLEKRAAGGNSSGPETILPPDERESEEALEMADEDVPQWEEWSDPQYLPPTSVPMFSVSLAAEEEREHKM
jgi:hypothetical protein